MHLSNNLLFKQFFLLHFELLLNPSNNNLTLIQLILQLLLNTFYLNQHFLMLPRLIKNTEDAHVLPNVGGELLDCHGSTDVEQLDQHVSFLVLGDSYVVLWVTSVFVDDEAKFFVDFSAFDVSVDVGINKLLDCNLIIVE